MSVLRASLSAVMPTADHDLGWHAMWERDNAYLAQPFADGPMPASQQGISGWLPAAEPWCLKALCVFSELLPFIGERHFPRPFHIQRALVFRAKWGAWVFHMGPCDAAFII